MTEQTIKYSDPVYQEQRHLKEQRRMSLKFLKNLKVMLNRQLFTFKANEGESDEDKDKRFGELLERLHGTELNIIKFTRNKLGSKFYEFIPNLMLNKKQKLNGKAN